MKVARWLMAGVVVQVLGCSTEESAPDATGGTGTGGLTSSGGSGMTKGGASGTGGTTAGGNAGIPAGGSATAGTATTGGAASTGGNATATGGAPIATGGTSNTGGAPTEAGGTSNTGGAPITAGTTSSGGTPSAGSGGGSTGGAPGKTSAGSGPPESGPQGYGQGTTGGGNKASQKAGSLAEIQALIDGYSGSGGLVIEYTGQFDFKSISDPCSQYTRDGQIVEIKRKGDITILGADGSSANFGIHIASTSSNVIVRNMTIGLTPGADASDIISIEGMSDGFPTKVWIDHNEFFTSMVECDGAGDTEFDGMIDLKKGADNVTISYNYLHDHHKVSLNGSSDTDTAARHITFHHNLFEEVGARVPLQRGGHSHIVNNHFLGVKVSGINVRMGGYALIEANQFEDVKNPVTSRDSDEIGFWDLRNNNLATASDVAAGNAFGISWDDGNDGTVNATDWKTSKAFPVALPYSYTADTAQCVSAGLRAVVGAGTGLKTLKCD